MPAVRRLRTSPVRGQSLIESCLAIAVLCLLFMGLFQIAQLFAAREVLHHAAARGARAKTVGFNWWMVEKCIRVAAIPNAGPMLEPSYVNDNPALQAAMELRPGEAWDWSLGVTPVSAQYPLESARIPEYLAAENWARAHYILDYRHWDTIRGNHGAWFMPDDGLDPIIRLSVEQDYPLTNYWGRVHRAFYAKDVVPLSGESCIEAHYPLYLDDHGW